MDSIDEHLSVREAVVLVIAAAGGKIEGRTAVQKLCYFAGLAINVDLGHAAHYYGPYSRQVEAALQNESFAGDLEEVVTPFGYGRDGRTYTYTLTPQGQAVVAELQAENPQSSQSINAIVQKLSELVDGLRQHKLSLAAKVDLILQQQGKPVSASEIPDLARSLGWTVTDDDVAGAVSVLVGLNRVETTPTY